MHFADSNETTEAQKLEQALGGDIRSFQALFEPFQAQLKSYLYRLTANREDAEDLAHDAFIRAFDRLKQFEGRSSLKTWVFQIATHLAYNQLKRRKRWTPDVSEQAKALVLENPALAGRIQNALQADPEVRYEIKEHIDTCFTCIGRNLPIEQQITLLLRDVYGFSIEEISNILGRSAGSVKHLLQSARNSMTDIFDRRCALVNKNGVCRQCSELNGWLNPKQDQQAALMQLDLVKGSERYDRDALYKLRAALVREIDPLRSPGAPLQAILLGCNRMAMGETPIDSGGAARREFRE